MELISCWLFSFPDLCQLIQANALPNNDDSTRHHQKVNEATIQKNIISISQRGGGSDWLGVRDDVSTVNILIGNCPMTRVSLTC